MGTAPPFVVQRLWLDRPVKADRAPFLGTGGRAAAGQCQRARPLRTGSRRSGPARTGGSVVELHSYAVTGPRRRSRATGCWPDCTSSTRKRAAAASSTSGC